MANVKFSDLGASAGPDADDLFCVEEDAVYKAATTTQVAAAVAAQFASDAIAGSKVAAATETARGSVELATTTEAETGTDTARAVTAAGVAAAIALHTGDTVDAHDASAISTVTTNFNNNLSAADDTLQKALDTLDNMTAGSGAVATDVIWDAKGDLAVGTGANTASKLTVGATNGHVLTIDSAQATGLKWAAGSGSVGPITCTIDGGGTIITTGGKKAMIYVPYACTITGWTLTSPNQTATVTVDVWNDTRTNYPPTNADSMISTGTKPALSAASVNADLTADWADLSVPADSFIEVEVESNDASTLLHLALIVEAA